MGRPYADELKQLRVTYEWAMNANIESLTQAIGASVTRPMLAVGSGGSFTAADFACSLHQSYVNMLARPYTPMEFAASPIHLSDISLMIVSAGGTNSDILGSFKSAMLREPGHCIVVSLRNDSPLSRLAENYHFVDLINFEKSWKKDGFLSTNSLLALVVLLSRSYSEAVKVEHDLPPCIDELTETANFLDSIADLQSQSTLLWRKQTILVVYSPNLHSAAVDLESKFTEAALGNIQLADFRNFAHGRHNWLAKRSSQTGILALFSDEDANLARRTLSLIPKEVPITEVHIQGTGMKAGVAGMVATMYLVGAAAKELGMDPGRPMIPRFGRRIYGLRGLNYVGTRRLAHSTETIAIARKTCSDVRTVRTRPDYIFWKMSYKDFITKLGEKLYSGVIFDYDGTLCEERNRFVGLQDKIIDHLTLLLGSGIIIGIATGRGKSARDELRKGLPRHLWHGVRLTYYNGSQIANLGDNNCPDSSEGSSTILERVADLLNEHPLLKTIVRCDKRKSQISIIPLSPIYSEVVYRTVGQIISLNPELKTLRSAHSIDIIPRDVSKSSLISHMDKLHTDILVIGDKGQWPGNDYDLLANPFSLSVNEVSSDPTTCWNLAPAGHRGVQATLDYLACLKINHGYFCINLEQLKDQYSKGRA